MAATGGSSAASCGACKFLRRKCSDGCVFAPYFSYEQGAAHFAAVHKVFGASNASKLLLQLPSHHRGDAAVTISFEALARMRDPVYGCVAYVFALQQQAARLQEEIESLTVLLTSTPNEAVFDPQALITSFLHQTSQLWFQDCERNLEDLHDHNPCPLDGHRRVEELHGVLPARQLEAAEGLDLESGDLNLCWEDFPFDGMGNLCI